MEGGDAVFFCILRAKKDLIVGSTTSRHCTSVNLLVARAEPSWSACGSLPALISIGRPPYLARKTLLTSLYVSYTTGLW